MKNLSLISVLSCCFIFSGLAQSSTSTSPDTPSAPGNADPVAAPTTPIVPADLTDIEGAPEPNAARMSRFQASLKQSQTGKFDIIFDGDSITDHWQTFGKPLWEKLYVPLHAIDLAIYGDQIQQVFWRLQHGELDGQDPKLVMLMIGTNNNGFPPDKVAEGIRVLLGEYEKRCPNAHFVLLAVFPRNNHPNSPQRTFINQVNAIISKLADEKRVTYLDINSQFLNPDGTHIKELYEPDGIHPSAKGYEVWATAIQPIIDQYFPKP